MDPRYVHGYDDRETSLWQRFKRWAFPTKRCTCIVGNSPRRRTSPIYRCEVHG